MPGSPGSGRDETPAAPMSALLPMLNDGLYAVLLVFARLGAICMVMPGLGEAYVNSRARLWIALGMSGLLAAALGDRLPAMPAGAAALTSQIVIELVLGLFIGGVVRLAMAALHLAGGLIAVQSGLAAATLFDPTEGSQGTLPGNLLAMAVLLLLFTTDGHHWLLGQVAMTYRWLPAGGALPWHDMVALVTRLGSEMMAVGLAIAGPIVLVTLLANILLGVMARLVPALQVMAVALPLQLLLSLGVFALSIGTSLAVGMRFLDRAAAWLAPG